MKLRSMRDGGSGGNRVSNVHPYSGFRWRSSEPYDSSAAPPVAWAKTALPKEPDEGYGSRMVRALAKMFAGGLPQETLECMRFNANRAERLYLGYTANATDNDVAMGICEALVNIEFYFWPNGIPASLMNELEPRAIVMDLVGMGRDALQSKVLSSEMRCLLEKTLSRYPSGES